MEEDSSGGEGGGGDPPPSPTASTHKGKSCKGCLYYSSLLKSDARNPMCFGISRSLPQVPGYIVGESEMEATKDGRSLSDFKYACVGYSVFLDNKDKSTDKGENQAELPFCAGIELLVDRRASNASHVPAHVHKEDVTTRSQPRAYKPAHSSVEEFFSRKACNFGFHIPIFLLRPTMRFSYTLRFCRFTRNAGLVTSGVARNLSRVGNYIKEHIDDILYPYRRRPK